MTIQDNTRTAREVMTSESHHEPVRGRYTPMRGQAYVQMLDRRSSVIHMLDEDPNEQKIHRGKVLALGHPARLTDHPDSPLVPWGIEVGDEVVFCLALWLDKMRVLEMLGVAGHVAVVAQGEVMGVWE